MIDLFKSILISIIYLLNFENGITSAPERSSQSVKKLVSIYFKFYRYIKISEIKRNKTKLSKETRVTKLISICKNYQIIEF